SSSAGGRERSSAATSALAARALEEDGDRPARSRVGVPLAQIAGPQVFVDEGADGPGRLFGDEVRAAGEQRERGAREEILEALGGRGRDEGVILAPDEEGGDVQPREVRGAVRQAGREVRATGRHEAGRVRQPWLEVRAEGLLVDPTDARHAAL